MSMTELMGYNCTTNETKSGTWMLNSDEWDLPNSPDIIVHGVVPTNSTTARTITTSAVTQGTST
ncbi:MAG: hypothetical protein M1368_09430 [Thaumarchaeota archaeon]|nr:hypothetical protein [Nitrososphaerota archaeon]